MSMKVLIYLSLVTLAYALEGHNLRKRVLPTNENCDPNYGECRKGDWVAAHIADCKYRGMITCDAVGDTWSWTVNVAVGNKCKPISGKRFKCGESGTNTRCVCSDTKLPFNQCKCQYWPPEDIGAHAPAFCTAYYSGGTSHLHHWACCNNCNGTSNTCDEVTWEGGSSDKYCSTCGTNTGGGQVKYFFNCGGCDTQQRCKSQCSRKWLDTIPGFCWKWIDCFKGCCLESAEQPRYKRDISELSFCGDGICASNENASSCPADCCYQINSINCTSNISECSPECCRESECCLEDDNNNSSSDGHNNTRSSKNDDQSSGGNTNNSSSGVTIVVILVLGMIITLCITLAAYHLCLRKKIKPATPNYDKI